MARKDNKIENDFESTRNKSSMIVYGVDNTLDKENKDLGSIVQQTIIDTKTKLGERTNGKPINYFNELNFGRAFNEIFGSRKNKDGNSDTPNPTKEDFKKYMEENPKVSVDTLLAEDSERLVRFTNYKIIQNHIPECANALSIYKDNIMSPDDYTKMMFNITYERPINSETKAFVEKRLDDINLKYQMEEKADQIIEDTLLLGESYVSILSLEEELSTILSDDKSIFGTGVLNEATQEKIKVTDTDYVSSPVLSENIQINNNELSILNEIFNTTDNNALDINKSKQLVAQIVNENVTIGSKRELLFERVDAELDKIAKSGVDIDFDDSKKGTKKKKKDEKPLFLNGSSIKILDPSKIVELKIDDICYGYYYAEGSNISTNISNYLGTSSGREVTNSMSLSQNNTISSTTSTNNNSTGIAAQLNIGEQKLRVIADLFINAIADKIDKNFVRKNKEFKDFIYGLIKQGYIINKGVHLTYFKPDEIVKFECKLVYKDIIFFAKLYLSILANDLVIKLGRAHDKRAFYINVGADAKYEEAINSVIQDIKTKEYGMDNLNDFTTILNLTPGRFDDYFIPTINGERPLEIDTLAGMDTEMNNEFVEYLKNSMMSGMGVPRNLIDTTSEVDFARSISAMNANFVRSVIRYQKCFTAPFTRIFQKLYTNEYRFSNDQENIEDIDINEIRVSFPSPATLAMSNLLDQFQAADQNAEYISSQIIPPKTDQSTEDERLLLKTEIVKDLTPSVDWDKYMNMAEEIKKEKTKENIKKFKNPVTPDNGYGTF